MSEENGKAGAGTIKCVAVIIAMEEEARPLLDLLELQRDQGRLIGPASAQVYSGAAYGLELHIICNGKCKVHGVDQVGTVPAALTAYLAMEAFKPDLVLTAGTAGGFAAQGGAVGDVYVSSSAMNHDRRIPIPGFREYGIGTYEAVPVPNLTAELGLKTGVVSSGNSLDYTKQDMEAMVKSNVAVKDMEVAAIAWAADLYKTPWVAIKAITDIVDGDHPTNEEFLRNLAAAAQSLQKTLPLVLKFVAGKLSSDL